jgi:hypothetical protein
VSSPDSSAEGRRVAVGAILAAIDGRDDDLYLLLAGADRDTLNVAVAGLAIVIRLALEEAPAKRRAFVRDYVAGCAIDAAARPE